MYHKMFVAKSSLILLSAMFSHAYSHVLSPRAVYETLGHETYEIAEIDTLRLNTTIDPPSSVVLPAGHVKKNGTRALPCDIRFDHNQAFAMRDNVTLRVDVFRPVTDDPVPALILWSPYGKSGSGVLNLDSAALRVGVAQSRLSGYESFEGLDPAEWVNRGYAVINVDARGSGDSEGNLRWWGSPEGEDGYDLIEQIAVQPWCSGRVALAGNSWLAISQWFIAAQQPPHLTAIAPLEGASDILREVLARGGVPNVAFAKLIQSTLPGHQQQEDVIGMLTKYPNRNTYWDDKRADMSKIQVPAYILGSYSTNLHTMGAFRGYEEIPHNKKWFTTHTTQEWYDLYSETRTEDLNRYFDFYLKDIQNGWEQTPSIRYSLLGYNLPNQNFSFSSLPWTQEGSKKLKLYLNPDQTLSTCSPTGNGSSAVLDYQADAPALNNDTDSGELLFNYTFTEKTYVVGPSKVVINLSSEKQNDLDVFVMLRKADANGTILQSINQPLSDLGVSDASEVPSVSVLKYLGPEGILRASQRAIAPELSKPWKPTLSQGGNDTVPQGDVIQLHLSLWPTGMIFEKGENLILKVSGHDMRLVDFESLQGSFQVINKGKHYVHFGSGLENYLDLNIL